MDAMSSCHLISSRNNGLFESRLLLDANPSCLIDTGRRIARHEAGHWRTSSSEVKSEAICTSTLP